MKAYYNLLLIFLIGLFSSTYIFSLSPVDYRDSILNKPEEIKPAITLAIDGGNTNLTNPDSIVVMHTSDIEMVLNNVSDEIFVADIYKNGELIKEHVTGLEYVSIMSPDATIVINKDNPMRTTLDISQSKLNLADGKYTIVLSSNIIGNDKYALLTLNVTYDSKQKYIKAETQAPVGTRGITLYFADKNANTLIPVTRYVTSDLYLSKLVAEELKKGPMNSNMSATTGPFNYSVIESNVVYIDLPSTYTAYNEGSTGGSMAYNSFINSLFALNNHTYIYGVKFSVDRKTVAEYFHGIDVSHIITKDTTPIVYLGMKTDERTYLFENKAVSVDKTMPVEDIAKDLFKSYNTNIPSYAYSPVPSSVGLNSAVLVGKTLKLDFNDSFLTAHNSVDLRNMMIDSLIYTFTSIEGVDNITITVNGVAVTDFIADRDITGILTPAPYINPETDDTPNEPLDAESGEDTEKENIPTYTQL